MKAQSDGYGLRKSLAKLWNKVVKPVLAQLGLNVSTDPLLHVFRLYDV
jgi:hypothetical protein